MEFDKEYQRSSGGILVPQASARQNPGPEAGSLGASEHPSDRISRVINLGSLAIQAITVIVLWITFKSTVIPAQQKELLAEQVARLEIDKKNTVADIAAAKASVSKLNSALVTQRSELARLSQERSTLENMTLAAKREAASAKRAEVKARASEQAANLGLTDARWRILAEEATWVIWRPIINDTVNQANQEANIGGGPSLTHEQEISNIVDEFDNNWPDFSNAIRDVANNLRAMRSPHYTPGMAAELSTAFLKEAEGFKCPKPDLNSIKRKYLEILESKRVEAKVSAEKSLQELREEYQEKRQTLLITDEYRRQTFQSHEVGLLIGVQFELRDELSGLSKPCSDRFVELGSKFLESKNRSPAIIPNDLDI